MKLKLLIAVIAAAILSACAPNYSEGERIGVITKISQKGLIWKSWEGSINQGGTRIEQDADGKQQVVPNAINFNVQDADVLKTIQQAAETGKRVKITYTQWFISPPSIDSNTVVRTVTILD